jgi:hypothetical protein
MRPPNGFAPLIEGITGALVCLNAGDWPPRGGGGLPAVERPRPASDSRRPLRLGGRAHWLGMVGRYGAV